MNIYRLTRVKFPVVFPNTKESFQLQPFYAKIKSFKIYGDE